MTYTFITTELIFLGQRSGPFHLFRDNQWFINDNICRGDVVYFTTKAANEVISYAVIKIDGTLVTLMKGAEFIKEASKPMRWVNESSV